MLQLLTLIQWASGAVNLLVCLGVLVNDFRIVIPSLVIFSFASVGKGVRMKGRDTFWGSAHFVVGLFGFGLIFFWSFLPD